VIGGLNARRGTIIDSEVREDEFTAIAEVALNDMFGYSSQLRGATQGKGEFSMEYKVKEFSLDLECRTDESSRLFFDAESHASVAECAG
jgi:translation elongation factor EF-G